MKRYWSTQQPREMTADEAKEWHAFDAKLTPQDIIEMQTIDGDCNDCAHFKRGAIVDKIPALFPKGGTLHLGAGKYFEGYCEKLDKPTRAFPTQYSGRECFEHRRANLIA
jgi:hypothetical protein